jgi:hypothetical protein
MGKIMSQNKSISQLIVLKKYKCMFVALLAALATYFCMKISVMFWVIEDYPSFALMVVAAWFPANSAVNILLRLLPDNEKEHGPTTHDWSLSSDYLRRAIAATFVADESPKAISFWVTDYLSTKNAGRSALGHAKTIMGFLLQAETGSDLILRKKTISAAYCPERGLAYAEPYLNYLKKQTSNSIFGFAQASGSDQ